MKSFRALLSGLLTASLFFIFVLGGLSQALAEGNPHLRTTLPPTSPATSSPVILSTHPDIATYPVTQPSFQGYTPTPQPHSTSCPPPQGWVAHTVQADETLEQLAKQLNRPTDLLLSANCLITTDLMPGTILYIPTSSTPSTWQTSTLSATHAGCGAPADWSLYTVQREDNLFRISLAHKISVAELQFANCMGTSTLIHVGDGLFVPPLSTQTPTTTPPDSPSATATHTALSKAPTTSTSTPTPASL